MAQRTFKIITLGCKVNQYESAYLEERLKGAGWRRASRNQKAEVTVVNTCIVTQRASYQSRQAVRKIIREHSLLQMNSKQTSKKRYLHDSVEYRPWEKFPPTDAEWQQYHEDPQCKP
jgi:phosphoribulokinase